MNTKVLMAECTLLDHRLEEAQRQARGSTLHRKEVALASVLVSLAIMANMTDVITHKLTEQDDERSNQD